MPKPPNQVSSLSASTKKVAKKTFQKPKMVFKKGEISIAEVLAYAADQEGIWVKDVPRFPDLIAKYTLPAIITESHVIKAHLLYRQAIRDTIERYRPESRETVQSTLEEKPKLKAVKKSVSAKENETPSPAKSSTVSAKKGTKKVVAKSMKPTTRIPVKTGMVTVKKVVKR